jgi:cell division inhibitor SepF
MSSLHKFKAYFGMVPTDDYDDEYAEGYTDGPEAPSYREPAFAGGPSRARGVQRDSAGYDSTAYEPTLDAPRSRPRVEPLNARRGASMPVQPTRGALAVDAMAERPVAAQHSQPFAEEGHPLAKITTLHPSTYNEARTIGERYREGTPVIMNLTEMSDSDAKRLVDFAAGLAFAMRGSIDKVTNKVFLLSPSNVDVSAEVKRHIVENGFYNHS